MFMDKNGFFSLEILTPRQLYRNMHGLKEKTDCRQIIIGRMPDGLLR